jgi:hypothetical protein
MATAGLPFRLRVTVDLLENHHDRISRVAANRNELAGLAHGGAWQNFWEVRISTISCPSGHS